MKKELTDLFKNSEVSEAQNFNSIKITLASPEKIKSMLDPQDLTVLLRNNHWVVKLNLEDKDLVKWKFGPWRRMAHHTHYKKSLQ